MAKVRVSGAVIVGLALLRAGSASAAEAPSPDTAPASVLLERLAALRPSPAELIEPPIGFSTTTPVGDLVAVAELTAEIERRAKRSSDGTDLHASAVTALLARRCDRAADLLRIALAATEVRRWRHDLGIAIGCSDPDDPLSRLEALEQLLRARDPADSGDSLVALARSVGLAIPPRSDTAPQLGTQIGAVLTARLFDWAATESTDPAAAAQAAAAIETVITAARAAGDHTLDELAGRFDAQLAAGLREFHPQHQRYLRGDCSDAPMWVDSAGLPNPLVLRRRLMAAACLLQQDRASAELSIDDIHRTIRDRSMRWLEVRVLWTAGVARVQAGDPEGARRAYAQALEISRGLGDPEAVAGLADRLLDLADRSNPATLQLAVEATIVSATQPSPRVRLAALLALARIAAEQGFFWTAHQATLLAEGITTGWDGAARGEVLAAHARAAGDVGRFDEADRALAEGFDTLEGSSDPAASSVRARLLLSRGKLAIVRRNYDLAAADFEAASAVLIANDLRSNAAAAQNQGPDRTTLVRLARLRALLAIEAGTPAKALEIACGATGSTVAQRLVAIRDPRGHVGLLWTAPGGAGGVRIRDWPRLEALLDGFAAAARQRGPADWGKSLLAQARELLPPLPFSDATAVEIIAEPELWAIPFEALWPELDLTLLAPSGSRSRPPAPINHVAAIGQLSHELAEVEGEIAAIATIWGARASAEAVDQAWLAGQSAAADLVHIAAHGPIPSQAQPPNGARLLVLNGCSTAGLERPSRYFELAWEQGTATIATLWDVDDTLAAEIAKGLHAELARGRSPSSALRAARAAQREAAAWQVDAWRVSVAASAEVQRVCPSLLSGSTNPLSN
jgi:hypothetical protein